MSLPGRALVAWIAIICFLLPNVARAKSTVTILDARSTTKEYALGQQRAQIVEATVENDGDQWVEPSRAISVHVEAAGVRTIEPASITRLAPGERAFIEIGIVGDAGIAPGTAVTGKIVADVNGTRAGGLTVPLTVGVPGYTSDPASLATHESPDWFDDAKFGIFIHWGVYSVPAFSRVGDYAEWYWHSMHQKHSVDYEHQLRLYGAASTYDQFIPRFTAQRFNPKAWVDLFHEAGARYFVLTSKHHEGFALFDTATTDRNAVAMGPHRDLVAALFTAARRYYPGELHPGLYYSLFEWYNPAYTGHPVPQYVTGEPIAYTGYKPIASYIDDHVLPQMREIVDRYHPQVLWCDGEWEKPSEYWHDAAAIAHYYNTARERGEGVALNDRCRVNGGNDENHNTVFDFSTPEYTTFSQTRAKKWEASRGMGFSYGYNAAEQPKNYKTSAELIAFLVDMVSKNGNFLLDIGPKADGTIPAIMQQRLRDMGAWLRVNGEAIYGSHYWWRASDDGNLRFTVQQNRAFYLIDLMRPQARVEVHQPIPIAAGDRITLLGYNGSALRWHRYGEDIIIDIPPGAGTSGRYAWTFKVQWR